MRWQASGMRRRGEMAVVSGLLLSHNSTVDPLSCSRRRLLSPVPSPAVLLSSLPGSHVTTSTSPHCDVFAVPVQRLLRAPSPSFRHPSCSLAEYVIDALITAASPLPRYVGPLCSASAHPPLCFRCVFSALSPIPSRVSRLYARSLSSPSLRHDAGHRSAGGQRRRLH